MAKLFDYQRDMSAKQSECDPTASRLQNDREPTPTRLEQQLAHLTDDVRRLQEGQIFQAVNDISRLATVERQVENLLDKLGFEDMPRLATVERKIDALVEALALVTAWMEVHTSRVDSLDDAVFELAGCPEIQLDATVKIRLN